MQVSADHVVIKRFNTKSGFVGDADKAVIDDWLGQPVDEIVPPRNVDRVVFERNKVVGRGDTVYRRHTGNGAFCHMHGHGDAIFLRHVTDFLVFENAARRQDVGVNDGYTPGFQQWPEVFFKIDVFACADGNGASSRQLDVLICQLPGDHVFQPGQVIFLKATRQLNAIVDSDMAEVIDCRWHFVADHGANVGNILLKNVEAFFRDVDVREGVSYIHQVVCAVAALTPFPIVHRRMRGTSEAFHLIKESKGGAEGTWFIE